MSTYQVLLSLLPLIIVNGSLIAGLIVFAFLYPHREKSQEILSRMHPTFLGVFVREYWYWLNSPFIKLFLAIKITPNMITIISLALGFVCAYFYYAGSFALAGWLLIISATLDILDGQLARLTGKVSKEGAFLDSCADRYSEGAIFFALSMYFASRQDIVVFGDRTNLIFAAVTMLALIGSQLVSYTRARGEAVGITTKAGIMQRAERVFLLAVISVVHPFIKLFLNSFGVDEHDPFMTVIAAMAALSLYSSVVRTVVIFLDIRKSSGSNG
jgi:phosphatidylglycerophosphate synthase